MTSSVAPFRLDEGVLLEDSGTMLPWSAGVNELLDLAGGYQTRWEEVTWSNQHVLGGLRANVRFILRRLAFEIMPAFDNPEDEEKAYRTCFEHLCNKMGAPHESRKDKSEIVAGLIYPVSIWSFEDIELRLRTSEGDSSGLIPFCDLSITRKKG
ncbi:MAG TPA: hypothetical protein V6D22_15200 [Candidatus Obscuribacterales bacterium]